MRAALANEGLSRAIASGCGTLIVEWSLWTGALVYAHDHGGATAAGLLSVAMIVPAAVVAPWAGSLADGPRPGRTLVIVHALMAACLAVAAAAALYGASSWAVGAAIVGATMATTYVRPACSVIVPGLVATARELTAANLVTGYADNGALLVGPLLAAALLAIAGPWLVFAMCAAIAAASAGVAAPLARLAPPPVAGRASLRRRWFGALEVLRSHDAVGRLLLVLAGEYVLIGGLDLSVVVLATEEFHLGDWGPGALGACIGAGAVVGGVLATACVGRRRLAPFLVTALAGVVAALAVLAVVTMLPTAVALLAVIGVNAAVLDVTGRMLLQRAAPQAVLASVFAALESVALVATAVGSIVVQVLLAAGGIRAAVIGLAAVLAVLVLATARSIRVVDDQADAPVVAIRVLRMLPVFGALHAPELEGVARAGRGVHVDTGQTVIRAGEPGDCFYAIAAGAVDVFVDGRFVRRLGRGQGFGEIALLADVPRTATVIAGAPTELLVVQRAEFLTAVTGRDASRQAAWAVARSYDGHAGGDDEPAEGRGPVTGASVVE